MFNNFFFPLPTVLLDFFCVSFFGGSFFGCFFGGSDDPPIIANILSCVRDLFGISVASSFSRAIIDASLVSEKKKKEKKSSETDKDKDRSTGKETKRNTSPGGGSTHRDQLPGNFTANTMIQCINEINQVEVEAAAKGKLPKLSQNKIQAKQ